MVLLDILLFPPFLSVFFSFLLLFIIQIIGLILFFYLVREFPYLVFNKWFTKYLITEMYSTNESNLTGRWRNGQF